MEDQLNEVLETVRFLKENMVFKDDIADLRNDVLMLKENSVTKTDLAETEQRLQREIQTSEQRIILSVCEFVDHNVVPQLDSMSNNMDVMGKDIGLIKTALQRPILHY